LFKQFKTLVKADPFISQLIILFNDILILYFLNSAGVRFVYNIAICVTVLKKMSKSKLSSWLAVQIRKDLSATELVRRFNLLPVA